MSACLVCGRAGARLRCDDCGVSFSVDDRGVLVAGAPDDVSYPATGADAMMRVEETSFWFAHRNEVIAHVLDRHAPGAAVWDVGGGNGFQALRLQQRGRSVVLVEPGAAGCANAVARGVRNVVRGALAAIRVPRGALAVVSMFDVIEHLADPVALLAEARAALRSDGIVVVTVPAHQALWSDEDDYAGHQRRYSSSLLRAHFTAAGFEVAWSSFFFAPLLLPIALLRALPYRLTRRRQNPEPDLSEHEPGGLAQDIVERLLARERAALARGATLGVGASIVAVGRPR